MSISPIPCHDVLNIHFTNTPSSQQKIFIFDLNGQLLHSSVLNNRKTILDVENLKAGHYVLLIEDNQSNIFHTYKFSKN